MQARLIAYPPGAPALTRWLEPGERLRIGRGQDCGVVLDHPSVSRAHAEIRHDGACWRLQDLGSKNGSHVDGLAIEDQPLPTNCWLRLGDTYCEFAMFDRDQVADIRNRQTERRALSAALTRQVAGEAAAEALPDRVLRGVVELAGCSRGFLLMADSLGSVPASHPSNIGAPDGDFSVRASLLLEPDALAGRAFSGSVGAVQRVLASGKPTVVNDVGSEAWLAERASVIAGGLQTLVCLPLLDGETVFGAVYADRRGTADARPGEPITDFDLALLSAFAESATLYLLARRAMNAIDARRPAAPRWDDIVQKHAAAPGIAAHARGGVAL